jgi:AraC family transcriptional regulator of adaptative response/methylated-DNA-[protein]-cysteine methyltransferase
MTKGNILKIQEVTDYQRVENAIDYITKNFKEEPSLEETASAINLSQYHFQRLFSRWVGVSPKKFFQYVKLVYAKEELISKQLPLLDVAYDLGFSSASRLHDLFVKVEGMTPGQFKNRGHGLKISYSFYETLFGAMIIGSTNIGICHMAFEDDKEVAIQVLKKKFPNAQFIERRDEMQLNAQRVFRPDWKDLDEIKLHLFGTPFQLKVWEALLKIPTGSLSTYGAIAKEIETPKSSRAVGTAIGNNPVAYLIPCHRVIRSNGHLGGYMWGLNRKQALIAWESLRTEE